MNVPLGGMTHSYDFYHISFVASFVTEYCCASTVLELSVNLIDSMVAACGICAESGLS